MAETKPVQPFADRTAMHRQAVNRRQFRDDLVQRQVSLNRQPILQPCAIGGQLALGMIALRLGHKPTALTLQDHHVVHKARRNPKMPCGLTMPVPLLDKSNDPAPKLHRMCFTHSKPLSLVGIPNHKSTRLGILNRKGSDTL